MKLQIAVTTIFLSAVALAAEDSSPVLTNLPDARKTALTSVVDRVLILQEFERRKLSIPKEFIDQQIAMIVAKDFGGDRSAHKGVGEPALAVWLRPGERHGQGRSPLHSCICQLVPPTPRPPLVPCGSMRC